MADTTPHSPQPPVIVVPGITATSLDDFYALPPQHVWSTLWHKQYHRLPLHPDDQRYDALEPALIGPVSPASLVYGDLIQALRHELGPDENHAPVFPFAYDWRQSCARSGAKLAAFIKQVRERCALMPQYKGCGFMIDLVAHSMGGLLAAWCLKNGGSSLGVRRVVSLGSPFRGSVDALLKMIIGKGGWTGQEPRDWEREAARTIPSLYQLLASYPGAVIAKQGAPVDLFQPGAWQKSIPASLNRFARSCHAGTSGKDMFAGYLAQAKEFSEQIAGLELDSMLPEGEEGWLAIAGVGAPTQVAIANAPAPDGNGFRFEVLDDRNAWPDDKENPATGDGTVPFLGSIAGFLPREKMVCVCPQDFSRWELKDLAVSHLAGFHAALPGVNLVQRLVIRHLDETYHGHCWAWKPPGVAPGAWQPPQWLEQR